MDINPEWNASYLRQPALPSFAPGGYAGGTQRHRAGRFMPSGYGADAASAAGSIATGVATGGVSTTIDAVSGAVSAVSGVASAWIGLKGQREQAAADEKSQRLAYKQQRESDIATQNMMTISLLQQQEAAKGRAKTAKTVVVGVGVVATLAVLGYVAVKMLQQP